MNAVLHRASLRSDDFAPFATELDRSLAGEERGAHFAPLEPWLEFDITAWPDEVLTLRGTAVDVLGTGNMLAFHLDIQRDQLRRLVIGIHTLLVPFPVPER